MTWQSNTCLFAILSPGVYPYLGRVAINCWRKHRYGENRVRGLIAKECCDQQERHAELRLAGVIGTFRTKSCPELPRPLAI